MGNFPGSAITPSVAPGVSCLPKSMTRGRLLPKLDRTPSCRQAARHHGDFRRSSFGTGLPVELADDERETPEAANAATMGVRRIRVGVTVLPWTAF
jgi:hypothetical protein